MATNAVFVGVNKHEDPSIPELSGARQDGVVGAIHGHNSRPR
jgi:hypothetical protein